MTARETIHHLFIVGAGFSHYAGLPLTADFTEFLLDVGGLKLDGPSALQVELLKGFVSYVFDHGATSPKNFWPPLEDIFTNIDLSANTGHHLGPRYSPADLRTVRRALIVRTIRMLRYAYRDGLEKGGISWNKLERFFSFVEPQKCAFLSMNWDTVIEQGLKRTQGISHFDYGCDALHAAFDGNRLVTSATTSTRQVQVLKPHGSANWLYCDACRQLYWLPPGKTDQIAAQLFRKSDWDTVANLIHKNIKRKHLHVSVQIVSLKPWVRDLPHSVIVRHLTFRCMRVRGAQQNGCSMKQRPGYSSVTRSQRQATNLSIY